MDFLIWIGILVCLVQSAIFSGLNLAIFSLSRLRLEVFANDGNQAAQKVLQLRENPNRTLVTVLWGNVGINVLLTLLSNSVLAGATAFLFSTFVITLFGEITPQAYFSRNALKMASVLAPVLKFYQVMLSPLVWPTAWMLDAWLGKETIQFFRESQLKDIIRRHMESENTDLDHIESIGALNFLTLDDLPVASEGAPLDPDGVMSIRFEGGRPMFPDYRPSMEDPFLQAVDASGKSWVVLVDEQDQPQLVLDADGFLRQALLTPGHADPLGYCHRPVVITDPDARLATAIQGLYLDADSHDDLIESDIILLWTDERRIITGPDILGRLMRGALHRKPGPEDPAG